jgi:sugar phosphate isomerase/epimerase
MELSVTTDYAKDTEDPDPYIKRIAGAGFSHIHWCHYWCTDFMYSKWETDQIEEWLKEYGLKVLDLHATAGQEKNWGLQREYERLAWLELVRNRIAMASQLGSDVIIMHAPFKSTPALFRKTIDELRQFAQEHHVRIAIENGDLNEIGRILSEYDPDYVCLCYDSGHGNMAGDGLDHLERLKDRLI